MDGPAGRGRSGTVKTGQVFTGIAVLFTRSPRCHGPSSEWLARSRPMSTFSPSERSPTIRRTGRGSSLINVGVARTFSSSASSGFSCTSITVSSHRPSSCRSHRSCNILIVRSDPGLCPVMKSFSRYFVILQFMDIIVIRDILHPLSESLSGTYILCSGRISFETWANSEFSLLNPTDDHVTLFRLYPLAYWSFILTQGGGEFLYNKPSFHQVHRKEEQNERNPDDPYHIQEKGGGVHGERDCPRDIYHMGEGQESECRYLERRGKQ
jgi:hypothetical protein